MHLTKKTMVLFDPVQYKKLEREAKNRGISVGAMIREAVERFILSRKGFSKDTKINAAKRLTSANEDIPDWEALEAIISRGHIE